VIRYNPPGVEPVLTPRVLELPAVKSYLAALDDAVPGLDLEATSAVAIGWLVAREIRAGRWESHRVIALRTFDEDEFETLALAAVSLLDPGPVPEPFASLLAAADAARAAGLSPAEAAERIAALADPDYAPEGCR
jgi:hypothetical protein